MNKTLKEDLERIHTLTYGKSIVTEGFLDTLLKSVGFETEKKVDDPKKADFVTDNVNDLFNSLETATKGEGLKQLTHETMSYQKEVESMQIGLILLGYSLPIHGVDGLYGPETGAAVSKFKVDNHLPHVDTGLSVATSDMLNKLIDLLKQRNIKPEDLKDYIDTSVSTGGGTQFTDLDLTTDQGFKTYSRIAQKFIEAYPPNPLGITGNMIATGALNAFKRFRRYVPPELALSQLVLEGGIGSKDPKATPVVTKNPYNVGNVDSGATSQKRSVQEGIETYFTLIAREYLGKNRTATDLISNFINKAGSRYASASNYESILSKLASHANRLGQQVISQSSKV